MKISRRKFNTAAIAATFGAVALPHFRAMAQENITVAYSNAEINNEWRVENQRDMKEKIEAQGWNFITASAESDPAKQLADIESLLSQRPTVLILSPIETVGVTPAVEIANDAGVPLIVIDRTLNAEPGNGQYLTEIVQDFEDGGRLLAEKAVQLAIAKNGAPKGNYVRIIGSPGTSPTVLCGQGWNKVMEAYPDMKLIGEGVGGFTTEGGIRVMQDLLQRFPAGEIDMVWSDYAEMTIGVLQAVKAAGRNELLGNIMSMGSPLQALDAIVAGDLARQTQTPPYYGDIVVENVRKMMVGETLPPRQPIPSLTFDIDDREAVSAYLEGARRKGLKF